MNRLIITTLLNFRQTIFSTEDIVVYQLFFQSKLFLQDDSSFGGTARTPATGKVILLLACWLVGGCLKFAHNSKDKIVESFRLYS